MSTLRGGSRIWFPSFFPRSFWITYKISNCAFWFPLRNRTPPWNNCNFPWSNAQSLGVFCMVLLRLFISLFLLFHLDCLYILRSTNAIAAISKLSNARAYRIDLLLFFFDFQFCRLRCFLCCFRARCGKREMIFDYILVCTVSSEHTLEHWRYCYYCWRMHVIQWSCTLKCRDNDTTWHALDGLCDVNSNGKSCK